MQHGRLLAVFGSTVLAVAVSAVGGVVVPSLATANTVRNGLIAYTSGNGEEEPYGIWTIKPDATGNRQLLRAHSRFSGGPCCPRWSRDGKKLLFTRSLTRECCFDQSSLWYSTASGKTVRRIRLPASGVAGYDWAPDGRRVVVAVHKGVSESMMYTMSLDGTHRKALRRGSGPSWSSDGRYILFTRFISSGRASTISVVRPDGTGYGRLTPSLHDAWPRFSPGGQKVVFVRRVSDFRSEWHTIDVRGNNDVLVAVFEGLSPFTYCLPQWTPDGTRLAAVRTDEQSILVGQDGPVTTALVTLTPSGQDERVAFTFPPLGDTYPTCDFSWQQER
jgi:Tol biopolymer transport system component